MATELEHHSKWQVLYLHLSGSHSQPRERGLDREREFSSRADYSTRKYDRGRGLLKWAWSRDHMIAARRCRG